MNFYDKYIKYKKKYLGTRTNSQINNIKQIGGNIRKPNNIILIDINNKKNFSWRNNLPLVKFSKQNKINFYDSDNKKIDLTTYEMFEQYLVSKWIKSNDIVLELGGRYGIVSCTINMLLKSKYKKLHTVIEPDNSIIKILLSNRKITQSKFTIEKCPINNNEIVFYKSSESLGLGNFIADTKKIKYENNNLINLKSNFEKINLQNITHEDFFNKFKQKFNVLIADCEGCLCDFFSQNEKILIQLEMIIFEMDNENICNYNNIYELLKKYNFILIDSIDTKKWNQDDTFEIIKFQQVWIKS